METLGARSWDSPTIRRGLSGSRVSEASALHSMVLDPSRPGRMWVGVSAAGVFGTEDGGASWRPMNQGVRADFLPDRFPEFGQCPHKMLGHGADPDATQVRST